ncbi:hypothetical protein [Pedobacter insulae]|uniref:Lipocalin-like domain-containing protein n=1 Tax=Pedobacter insulae TaxID=414048 RepID=A0A1I2VZL6_9SPHI|nr:hypothetical protein [Pedobacter insulae]SFG94553.1 hypothetical protein SAMN04489864_103371 [Pedobacter insulae]
MRKYIFSVAFFAFMAIIFFTCKKDEINDQEFVKNHFVGRWPLLKTINITTKNGDTTVKDTVYYGLDSPKVVIPIDTLLFTKEDKYIKAGDTVNYTIDETGDHISFSTIPAETWKIKYLRLKSIILTREKTEKKGSDTFIYYTEEQLIRN